MAEFTLHTPWGKAESYSNLGQGVFSVSTETHGGIFVPEYMLHNIPSERRADAAKWSGSEQWYEEDCCWAYVAEAIPDRFDQATVGRAKQLNADRGK